MKIAVSECVQEIACLSTDTCVAVRNDPRLSRRGHATKTVQPSRCSQRISRLSPSSRRTRFQTLTFHVNRDEFRLRLGQFVRVCMDNQPANVRLFVMHGGVETFVDLIGNAFQHAHSLSASSSSNTNINANGVSTTAPSTNVATRSSAAGSEEDFGLGAGGGAEAGPTATLRNIRRERASDMSVALTCRELVVECISCLSSALEVNGNSINFVGRLREEM